MRKEEQNLPVIEWSASKVVAFDPVSRNYATGPTIADVSAGITGKKVIVALSRRSSFVRTARVPDAPKEQVLQVLKIQLPNLLPIVASDIAFDFRLAKNVNEEGRLAVIGAVGTETLKTVLQEVKEAGLHAVAVIPVAFSSGVLAQSLSLESCAIAEESQEGLAIDIIADSELRYTRTVPMPKDGEGIADEVCRTFNVARVSCSHIVAAGGLRFAGADTIAPSRPLEVLSAGLAGRLDLNIELPEAIEQRARKARGTKAMNALFLWLAVAAVGAFVYLDRTDAVAKITSDNVRYNSAMKQLTAVQAKTKADLSAETALQAGLSAAYMPAQTFSDVITEVCNKMPPDKMWTSGFTLERGKPFLIRGTAVDSDSVAAYVQALAIDPRFRDVKLVFANNGTIDAKQIVEFSIQMHVMGNTPLNDPLKTSGVQHS
jgi:hypothetical protein